MTGTIYVPPTEHIGVPLRERMRYVAAVAQTFLPRLTAVMFLLLLAGLAEGFGIAVLLPLLSVLTDSVAAQKSALETFTLYVLNTAGLDPRIGVLLTLIVIGMSLKASLLMVSMSLVGTAMAQTSTDLRMGFMRAILAANWRFFTNTKVGNITNAMSRESDRAAALLAVLTRLAAAVISVTILLTMAWLVSWQITAAALGTGALLLLVMSRLVGVARRAGYKEASAYVELSSRLSDAIQGIKGLKAMAREHLLAPLFARELSEINNAMKTNVIAAEASRTIPEPLLVAVLAVGLYAAVTIGERPVESLIVMAFLFYRSAGQFGQIQRFFQTAVQYEGFFVHMIERTRQAENAAEENWGTDLPTLKDGISVQDVSFKYGETAVLENVSIEVQANRITSLIGASGGGKTTLVDLILGLQQTAAGQILIDGKRIKDVDMHAWRSMIGYVPQELFLFHDTVRQNITLGASDITEADIDECLKAAGAAKFVSEMPDGLDTVVGERGSKISGGQRQRIALARALLMHPALLVLDEPTTALDPETEAQICATLKTLGKDLTILAISHQPAIAGISDVIYRIEAGKILETFPSGIGASE